MNIIKIDDQTIQFDEGHVSFFLLIGDEKALLIDSGMQTKNAKELAMEFTDKPIELLNTHADLDHIASNQEFEWTYMHPNELMQYTGKIKPVWDQDQLDLGNRLLQIIHIPGHTPGAIAVLDIKKRILFSGDSVQEEGKIFMFGPMRNVAMSIFSLERLEKMNGFDLLYPSHAKCPVTKEIISKIKKQSKEIIEKDIPFQTVEMFDHLVKSFDNGVSTILVD